MIFLEGREFTGEPPGLRTIQRGPLMLVYLTDVRGERVVIIQVNWISLDRGLSASASTRASTAVRGTTGE